MEYIKKNREIHGLFCQNFTKIFFPSKFQICLAFFFVLFQNSKQQQRYCLESTRSFEND